MATHPARALRQPPLCPWHLSLASQTSPFDFLHGISDGQDAAKGNGACPFTANSLFVNGYSVAENPVKDSGGDSTDEESDADMTRPKSEERPNYCSPRYPTLMILSLLSPLLPPSLALPYPSISLSLSLPSHSYTRLPSFKFCLFIYLILFLQKYKFNKYSTQIANK